MAQTGAWPTKPVRIVVAYPAGGLGDVMARSVGQVLSENLGQPFVVDYKPGAGGNLGADFVAKSPADGYTLCLCSTVIESVNPFLFSKMSYDPNKDVVPVAATGRIKVYLVTRPGMDVANVKDFVERAKSASKPLAYGSAGAGSTPHLVSELFKRSAGFDATHVPYRGAAPAMQDLLGGAVDFFFDPGLSFQYVREGKVKMLGVASDKRSPLFPDVPTFNELGFKGLDYDTWFGLYGPAAMPAQLVKRINDEVNKALANEPLRKRYMALGAEAVPLTAAEFKAVAVREKEVFQRLIQENGIRGD